VNPSGSAAAMRAAAEAALTALGTGSRPARFSFGDAARTRWSYTPRDHAGAGLAEMGLRARKAFHRLLATALSRSGLAQAVTIMGLEEVLDLDEAGRLGRHSSGYHLAVFGEPEANGFTWRIEGHHLSVSATVVGDAVSVGPVFLGARPHKVACGHIEVVAPLGAEEAAARGLLDALPLDLRREALVDPVAPGDIRSGNSPRVTPSLLQPAGVAAAKLAEEHRGMLADLAGLYLGRLAPGVRPHTDPQELHFAFLGRAGVGHGHSYRVVGPGLLIEYCNHDGDHAHTVVRSPGGDFGYDLLAAGTGS